MADIERNSFINPLFDIKYNLTQDIEEEPVLDEIKATGEVLSIWKNYIITRIVGNGCIRSISEYKSTYKSWFRRVKNIFDNVDEAVKIIVPVIGNQILQFFEMLLEFYNIKVSDIIDFVNHLNVTSLGSIDCIKAVTFLLNNIRFSDNDKYSIACYFCLEEAINELHQNSYDNFEIFLPDDIYRSRMFWNFYLNDQSTEFNQHLRDCLGSHESNYEHLLLWSIRRENESAVQHFLEKLCQGNALIDVKRFVSYALNFNSSNIVCFLISRMYEEEQINSLCIEEGYAILEKLGNNFRYRDCFQKAVNYIFQFIGEMNFKNFLKVIVFCYIKFKSERNQYLNHLREFSFKFEVNIVSDFLLNQSLILKILLAVDDENIVRNLLETKSIQDVKDNIDTLGLTLIYYNYSELFVTLVEKVVDKNESDVYKNYFWKKYGSQIFFYLHAKKWIDYSDKVSDYFHGDKRAKLSFSEEGKTIPDTSSEDAPRRDKEYDVWQFINWCLIGKEKIRYFC